MVILVILVILVIGVFGFSRFSREVPATHTRARSGLRVVAGPNGIEYSSSI